MPEGKPKPCHARAVFSPSRLPLPGVHPSDHGRLRVPGYGALPPHHAHYCFPLWEVWGRSLSSPFSLDAGPLRQQAARACPGVTPRGGCGQEQGAHSAAAAASGQPTGWPGWEAGRRLTKAGRDWGWEEQRQRDREKQRDRETQRQKERQTGTAAQAAPLPLWFPQVEGLRLAQPLVRLQPPKVFLVQLRSRPKWGLRGHQGRHPKQPLPGGILWAVRDAGPGFEY